MAGEGGQTDRAVRMGGHKSRRRTQPRYQSPGSRVMEPICETGGQLADPLCKIEKPGKNESLEEHCGGRDGQTPGEQTTERGWDHG